MAIRFREHENLLIPSAAIQLQQSLQGHERWLGNLLEPYVWLPIESLYHTKELVAYLGVISVSPEYVDRQQLLLEANPNLMYKLGLPNKAFEWGMAFLIQILKEVRSVICGEQTHGRGSLVKLSDYRAYPKALGVSLSTSIMAQFGVNEPMAIGIATLVLLTLAQATKDAFCQMTDEEVLKTLNPDRKN